MSKIKIWNRVVFSCLRTVICSEWKRLMGWRNSRLNSQKLTDESSSQDRAWNCGPQGSYPWDLKFIYSRQDPRPHGLPIKLSMRSAVSRTRNRCHFVDLTVFFLFGLVTANWVFWISLTRDRSCTLFVDLNRELKLLQTWWSRAKSGTGVVEPFGGSCRAELRAEVGKSHLFGLANVCRDSEHKKRQLCKLHKIVSTCDPDEKMGAI